MFKKEKISPTFFMLMVFLMNVIASCSSAKKQPFGRNSNIENKRWVLREINGTPVQIKQGSKELFISFSNKGDNTFTGSGTCNTMDGMYTAQDDMIKIHKMQSTMMSCDQMQMETEYFNMLNASNRFEYKKLKQNGVDKEFLFLFADKKLIGKFEALWLQ